VYIEGNIDKGTCNVLMVKRAELNYAPLFLLVAKGSTSLLVLSSTASDLQLRTSETFAEARWGRVPVGLRIAPLVTSCIL